jgi:hypothetical protein
MACIILLYTHLAHSKCIKKVATLFYQGSHTGQEVIFDLFFCFPTFENLDGICQNTDRCGERKGCNAH